MAKDERDPVKQSAHRARLPRNHASQSHDGRKKTHTVEGARREPVRQSAPRK